VKVVISLDYWSGERQKNEYLEPLVFSDMTFGAVFSSGLCAGYM
jgi:hypothetical protein